MGSYVGGHNASRQQTIKDKRTTKRNQKQKCRLRTARNEITGGGGGGGGGLQLVCGRPTLVLSSALVPQALSCLVCVEDS